MDPNQDTQAQLAALLTQMQAAGMPLPTTIPSAGSAWGAQPKPQMPTEVLGVSIPISLDTPNGKLRVYLNFPGSAASSPEALMNLVQQLANSGIPLDTWQPKQQGNGWGGGNRGGGYGGNRGGGGNRGWGGN